MEPTYRNPVYDGDFPDPFVLKYRGEYWAYGTGTWRDGRWFGVLRSRDLARWEEVGGAMEPLPGNWPCRWAPEVSYHNGRFFLYYSLGDETTMELRVAVAGHPAGPFVDSGRRLSHEPFAIDAHVFVDDDGARYLFYATDFLEHSHVGTGTARVRLLDPLTPAGPTVPVTRARYDWHVYDPQRAEKGGVRWHTLEGPFVLKRKGRYFQMFSGGNWQNPSYGVSYALAERLDGAEEWAQTADGERILPILRTVPGVVGPGHNSAVRGPNNVELFCVYHRWADDKSGRVMAIDRLDWAGERMLLLGPTGTPQPVYAPTAADFFAGERLGAGWRLSGGTWHGGAGEAVQSEVVDALATHATSSASYVAEVSARSIAAPGDGAYGVALGDRVRFLIQPGRRRVVAALRDGEGWAQHTLTLPDDFMHEAYHLLRVEVNAGRVLLRLDEAAAHWETRLPADTPLPLALCTAGASAAFAGFALTAGWSDLFYPGEGAPELFGWQAPAGWQVRGGALVVQTPEGMARKGHLPAAYELVISARLEAEQGSYGFYPAIGADDPGPLVLVHAAQGGASSLAIVQGGERTTLALPSAFDPAAYQQLRALVRDRRVVLSWEGRELAEIAAPRHPATVGLTSTARAAFEAVRVTDITQAER